MTNDTLFEFVFDATKLCCFFFEHAREWNRRPLGDHPGDVLLWGGRTWSSRAIQFGTCSWKQLFRGQWFSHIGICGHWQGVLKHWESTTLCPLVCEAQNKLVNGVQCHDPYREIAEYDGCVWLLKMREPLRPLQVKLLEALLEHRLGTNYDLPGALIAGTTWVKRLMDPDASTLFCDEFVAMTLIDMHIVSGFNPSTITPAWLAWKLVNDFKYEPAVRIK